MCTVYSFTYLFGMTYRSMGAFLAIRLTSARAVLEKVCVAVLYYDIVYLFKFRLARSCSNNV